MVSCLPVRTVMSLEVMAWHCKLADIGRQHSAAPSSYKGLEVVGIRGFILHSSKRYHLSRDPRMPHGRSTSTAMLLLLSMILHTIPRGAIAYTTRSA